MDFTGYAALAALLVSGAALALEVRRWIESGPRLYLSVIGDGASMPNDDGKKKLFVTVINRGSAPTEITHFLVFSFPTLMHRLRMKPAFAAIVQPSRDGVLSKIPARIDSAGRWMGMAYYGPEMITAREHGRLYVGIMASHSDRYLLKRVPVPKNINWPGTEVPQTENDLISTPPVPR